MANQSAESRVRDVIARIDVAWRQKQFDGLADCFHEHATICGPGYVPYAIGSAACSESYREFALNASVLHYSESGHELRLFETSAVYTFTWEMSYQREQGPKQERGTDQLVFANVDDRWKVVFRHIFFEPST